MAAFLKYPKVNPTHIGLEAKDGVVTLSGYEDNCVKKLNTENLVEDELRNQSSAIL